MTHARIVLKQIIISRSLLSKILVYRYQIQSSSLHFEFDNVKPKDYSMRMHQLFDVLVFIRA